MKIVPAIDLKNGRCVRLYQGDFDRVTDYSDDPAAVARRFSGMGFDYLHVVDLDGAQLGSQSNQESVRAIHAASSMSVQLGGGIRTAGTLKRWFDAGVKRCVVGSVAVVDPALVKSWIQDFSADRIVLALDVNIDGTGVPRIATHGWQRTTELSLWDCIDGYIGRGLQHVLCTDIGRDGAMAGPNVELYTEAMRRYPELQFQASGGVRDIADLRFAAETGVAATITGRALLDGRITAEELATFPQSA